MLRDRFLTGVRAGVRAGVLAAAVTAGALVGLGLRHDLALEPFLAAGRDLLPSPDGLVPLGWLALTSGLALHVAWMLAWGTLFALIAMKYSRLAVAVLAVVFVASLGVLDASGNQSVLGVVGSAPLSVAQRALVLALMAAALFAGVRFAQVSRR